MNWTPQSHTLYSTDPPWFPISRRLVVPNREGWQCFKKDRNDTYWLEVCHTYGRHLEHMPHLPCICILDEEFIQRLEDYLIHVFRFDGCNTTGPKDVMVSIVIGDFLGCLVCSPCPGRTFFLSDSTCRPFSNYILCTTVAPHLPTILCQASANCRVSDCYCDTRLCSLDSDGVSSCPLLTNPHTKRRVSLVLLWHQTIVIILRVPVRVAVASRSVPSEPKFVQKPRAFRANPSSSRSSFRSRE